MANSELVRAFERIADLLEIDGADGFRINSYRRAARTLKDAGEDAAVLAKEGRIQELPGIGKGTAQRIQQFLDSGHIDVLDELEAKFPPGLPALLDIPGMGPKKVALVHSELRVKNLDDLKKVIASGEMEKLPGLGATSVKKIAEGIAFLEKSGDRTPLGIALPIAEVFLDRVRALRGVKQAELAGSLRRGLETIGDIDIVCDAADGEKIIKQFIAFEGVKRILAAGATKGSVTVEIDAGKELQIDLRVVASESYGAALQYFTGSKEHNVRLRERAITKKWRLNEYGLFDGERSIAGKREADIYKKLGLPCLPPELREDRGEFDPPLSPLIKGGPKGGASPLAKGGPRGVLPELVTLEDIRGDLHMHTVASDGRCTIEEMAAAAKARGYEYIAICDHSKSSTIANGLSVERMVEHMANIPTDAKKTKGIAILVGCECDILSDGSTDYPNEILAQCDWVVASIHSALGSTKHNPTDRTLAAIDNPYVSMIGHPTGRLLNKRAAMDLDMAAIVEAAAKNGTMLEINSSWQRLDLKDMHVRMALAAGVTLGINTDAHHTEQLAQMRFGVITARRGGATKSDVVNCLSWAALQKRIQHKRL